MELTEVLLKQLEHTLPIPGKTGVDWYLFSYFLSRNKNTKMLEIGAGSGGSTLTMASYAKNLTVIDSWHQGWDKKPVEDLIDSLRLPVKFIDKLSKNVSPTELESYEFVHIDANKGYNDVITDLDLASKVCNNIICVDDYLQSMWPEVTWATDDWLKTSGWNRILIGNHQVFLSKKSYHLPEIVVNWSIVDCGKGLHVTYGKYPSDVIVNNFINAGAMKYSWHEFSQSKHP